MGTVCPSTTPAQYMVFFFGLYVVALGTGGIKPCVDQYCLDDLDYDRIIKNIERGEARISRKDEIMKAIGKKLDRYKNPWLELKIQYGQNKGKLYNEECDRFMICMVHKLGYGNWDELKAAFRTSPLFRFDWFVKSRTTQELARRCDTLIRLVEKENQEYDERERQARKEKKLAKTESPSSLKKRKQLTMDDYVTSGKRRK
uniref:SLIDE domain-containing protein n=2 Tax=Quercus lobata TaxID=97700 RepID=A0A7N2R0T2_QUELO